MNMGIGVRYPIVLIISILVLCTAVLSGCLSQTKAKKTTIDQQIVNNQIQVPAKEEAAGKEDVVSKKETKNEPEPIKTDVLVADGSWEHIAKPGILGLVNPVKKIGSVTQVSVSTHLDLAFDNAELTEVLDLLLYDHFGIKYMIDPSLKAKLTFHIEGEFSNTTIIDKLNSILHVSSISIVEGVGSIFKVVRKNDSARSSAFELSDTRTQQKIGDITRQIKIKYLNAIDTAKMLKPFLSKNALIIPSVVTNSILITDTPENIIKAVSIINVLDVAFFADISWKIFPVYEAKAETIAIDLEKIFKAKGLFSRPGMTNGSYQIQPIKTVNAILVVTKWPEILGTIDHWIKIMDQANDDSSDVFVYYVENGYASDLSDILKEVYGGKVSEAQDSGSQKIVQSAVGKTTAEQQKKSATAKAVQPQATVSKKRITGDLIDEVKIIADETNNAIIFKANPRDFVTIKKILKKLDITPRQVLLNVVVAEVTLSDSLELGVQWMLNNKIGGYDTVAMSDKKDSFITSATGLGTANGLTFGAFNSADALRALVTAVGTDSNINILSSPNIIGVDNKEAVIEVTEETPTITGSVTDSNGGVTNTVQFKKTGIILKATPSINSRGLVKLDLSQEVSERGAYDEETENYIFTTRKAITSLVVEDKQTIFIGGMMRERTSVEDQGVPFFKDIPILGYLFKSERQTTAKTELIILITPHVIRSRSEADLITKEFTEKISQVKELIDK